MITSSRSRAADALHITQQSLSAAIAALERELGCPLVVRCTPLELTYAGRVFLQYAERFHQTRDEMQRTFCDIAENQRGELRVGIAYTRGRAILPGILEAFAGVYPNVRVILTEERNHTLQNLLHEGRVDLAIARFQKPLPGIEVQPFYTEDTVLLVSRQLLQTCGIDLAAHRTEIERGDLRSLRGCPFVSGSAEDITGSLERDAFRRAGFVPEVRAESSNVETLLELCAGAWVRASAPRIWRGCCWPRSRTAGWRCCACRTRWPTPSASATQSAPTHGACWRTSSASPARSIRSRHENTPRSRRSGGMCFGMAYLFQGLAGSGSVGSQPRFGLEMSSHGADGFGTGRDEAL